ncbi:hypothetical protein QJS10_CPB19g00331 [Acorus calamus]|uniref:Reverse transcriptase zinc-binding domain-containing protein n=1 Tax=Acorus calamus TaxID=4465 RepID=A0AAV9CKM5_ACOCL|nr:hypothetical protein QJS10_CPB19g00331 [Acorus calamus]
MHRPGELPRSQEHKQINHASCIMGNLVEQEQESFRKSVVLLRERQYLDRSCPVCSVVEETTAHIILECGIARQTWSLICSATGFILDLSSLDGLWESERRLKQRGDRVPRARSCNPSSRQWDLSYNAGMTGTIPPSIEGLNKLKFCK